MNAQRQHLLGTEKVLTDQAGASQPVATLGTALPTLRSVKTAGQMVKGHALYTVNVRDATIGTSARMEDSLMSIMGKLEWTLSVAAADQVGPIYPQS
jgi:hypothetical protein